MGKLNANHRFQLYRDWYSDEFVQHEAIEARFPHAFTVLLVLGGGLSYMLPSFVIAPEGISEGHLTTFAFFFLSASLVWLAALACLLGAWNAKKRERLRDPYTFENYRQRLEDFNRDAPEELKVNIDAEMFDFYLDSYLKCISINRLANGTRGAYMYAGKMYLTICVLATLSAFLILAVFGDGTTFPN